MSDRPKNISSFFLEPTDQVEVTLRRFCYPESAEDGHYHDANKVLLRGEAKNYSTMHADVWPHNDPNWPLFCKCGYEFIVTDEWQFNPHKLFRRSDNRELVTLQNAPEGAIWDCDWLADVEPYKTRSPDGKILTARCPGGFDWCIDGPASNGPGWSRDKELLKLTVSPSIQTPNYHGFLVNGVFNEC